MKQSNGNRYHQNWLYFELYCMIPHPKRGGVWVGHTTLVVWASYQIRKIAGCACAWNAGNVSPHRRFQRKPIVSDPSMHHGTRVTHVPWCMSGSLTLGGGENVPGIPGACAPAILRIWQLGPCMVVLPYNGLLMWRLNLVLYLFGTIVWQVGLLLAITVKWFQL